MIQRRLREEEVFACGGVCQHIFFTKGAWVAGVVNFVFLVKGSVFIGGKRIANKNAVILKKLHWFAFFCISTWWDKRHEIGFESSGPRIFQLVHWNRSCEEFHPLFVYMGDHIIYILPSSMWISISQQKWSLKPIRKIWNAIKVLNVAHMSCVIWMLAPWNFTWALTVMD